MHSHQSLLNWFASRGLTSISPPVLDVVLQFIREPPTRPRNYWASARPWVKLLKEGVLEGRDYAPLRKILTPERTGDEEELSHQLNHRRIFRTKEHYVGKGGVSVGIGYEVWILENGQVPFVMRPVPGEVGKYMLIGECYMHGIMHGELVRDGKVNFHSIDLV
jgi:hypothetical protein